jgi:hypothetical protein
MRKAGPDAAFFRPKTAEALYYSLDGTLGGRLRRLRRRAPARLGAAAAARGGASQSGVEAAFSGRPGGPRHAAFLENAISARRRGRGHRGSLLDIRLADATVAGCAGLAPGRICTTRRELSEPAALRLRPRRPDRASGRADGRPRHRPRSDPHWRQCTRADRGAAARQAAHLEALAEGRVGVGREKHGAVLYQRLVRTVPS